MPRGKYIRTKKARRNIGRAKLGIIPWNKGIKTGHIPWNKGKIRLDIIGNTFAKGNKPNKTSFKKGEHTSIKTEFKKGEMSEKMKGEKNHRWKGGLTNLQKKEKIAGRKKPDSCEICGGGGIICFDHDHKTGKFRGWICSRCNFTLGNVKDNSELLIALAEYLRKYD